MDLSNLSSEELTRSLQSLQRASMVHEPETDAQLQEAVQELQVFRIELEMQNRTLRESQTELEGALQRYTDLYDHLPIGYVTLTPSGQIVQANLTAAGWLRRDRPQLIGAHMSWFFDAFDAGRFAAHLESCVKNGYESLPDVTLRVDSGLLLTVQLSSRRAPGSSDRQPLIHTAITNIVKLKQAQEILTDISREHDAFTQSIAQDQPSPVIIISNYARHVLSEHAASLNPEVRDTIERMECAAMRMEATLHHLLEYCCLGTDDLALDPVSLDAVLQHLMIEHRGMIQRYRAEITVERSMPCVRASRLVLAQVLTNVLTHCLKSPAGGLTPRLRVSAETKGADIVLKFSDETFSSQPGSPSDKGRSAPDVSARFRVFEGQHGFGVYPTVALAIIRRAVERMHGRVWVESEPGKPNSFNLQLTKI